MNHQMREELKHFFTNVKYHDEVKVIILTGEGNSFSAGGDLSTLNDIDAILGRKRLQAGHDMIKAILNLEKPVIAAVNGAAAGAGFSLAIACDMIIASRSAIFIQSFVKVGLIPDLGSIYFLPKLVGRQRALELMFLGEKITAEQAAKMGIVNHIVEDETLLDTVNDFAKKLVEGPKLALGIMKKFVNTNICSALDESLELEALGQSLCFDSADFKEGVQAFLEKRKPIFNQ